MIELGKIQNLTVLRFKSPGAYLDAGDQDILLPHAEIPSGTRVGDSIDVFVYRDSEDRLIATSDFPVGQAGECVYLRCAQINKFGAFLDWGLRKELFVPYAEHQERMSVDRWYVVRIYVDNTGRLAGSTKLSKFLHSVAEKDVFKNGQKVKLMVNRPTELGYECIVNNTHVGMIFKSDQLTDLDPGDELDGYVKDVRADGKIDLAMQPVSPQAKQNLAEQILAHLEAEGGSSTLTDKSPPDDIFQTFGVSKKAFKKALGSLYKSRQVEIGDGEIRLK